MGYVVPEYVLEAGSQPVDVVASVQAQVAEHVVEGPVLEHEHHDLVDPVQRGYRVVACQGVDAHEITPSRVG
jgi:hypothetical protein